MGQPIDMNELILEEVKPEPEPSEHDKIMEAYRRLAIKVDLTIERIRKRKGQAS